MERKKQVKMSLAEKIALYREAKLILEAPGGSELNHRELFNRAAKVLPVGKRKSSATYSPVLYEVARDRHPPTTGSKNIVWQPFEWEKVLAIFERERALGRTKKAAGEIANQSLPEKRQRNSNMPNFTPEIGALIKALEPFKKRATESNPFPGVKIEPTPEPQPEPAPQPAQSPPSDALTALGPVLGTMITHGLSAVFEALGREIGKQVAISVEHIGDKVAESVTDALYQMRMGILTGRQPTIQGGQPIPERKIEKVNGHEAPKPATGQDFFREPKVVIVGLLPAQEKQFEREFPKIKFRFISKDAPADRIKALAESSDACYVMLNFVGHSVTDSLRRQNGGPGYKGVKGLIDALRLALKDDWTQQQTVARQSPRAEAEAQFQ